MCHVQALQSVRTFEDTRQPDMLLQTIVKYRTVTASTLAVWDCRDPSTGISSGWRGCGICFRNSTVPSHLPMLSVTLIAYSVLRKRDTVLLCITAQLTPRGDADLWSLHGSPSGIPHCAQMRCKTSQCCAVGGNAAQATAVAKSEASSFGGSSTAIADAKATSTSGRKMLTVEAS
jgi:hypothetical protein